MSRSHSPIIVTHQDNVRFLVQAGDHQLVVDQPRSNGGGAAGPAPLEFLAVALGSCIAYYVKEFCLTRAIPYDGMRVEVRYDTAAGPARVERFAVRIVLPADVPDQYLALLERVARSCPAHNTLAHGAEVSIDVQLVPDGGQAVLEGA